MTRNILVDPNVYDLAVLWLTDDDTTSNRAVHNRRVMSLAQAIQGAIEDWCEDETREAAEQADRDEEQQSLRGLTDIEKERV